MAGKGTVTVEISPDDLRELRRLLRGNALYAEPWRDGMSELATKGGIAAQRGAPVGDTHKLQGSVRARVHKAAFPQWVAVRVGARKKGYPYPRLLAFSGKHGHRDWLLRAVMPVWQNAEKFLERIGNEIGKRWERGV